MPPQAAPELPPPQEAPHPGHGRLRVRQRETQLGGTVDAPAQNHFTIMPPDLNEITNPQLTYLRLHGRDARAYTTGKTVAARFNYDYSDEEIGEVAQRARGLAE